MSRVSLRHVDVADSIIHLILIVFVLGVFCHSFQFGNHLFRLSFRQHLRLLDASIEFHFVGRILRIHLLESLECFLIVANLMIQLSEQEVEASLLYRPLLTFDGLQHVRNRFLVLLLTDLAVGQNGCFGSVERCGETISLGTIQQVFCIIVPFHLCIALCFQHSCLSHDVRFGCIQALDIGKCRCCLEELTFLELCISHQEPCFIQEWVVLLLSQPQLTFGSPSFRSAHIRLLRDAMLFDGFLTLLNRTIELTTSQLHGVLVAHHVVGQHLHVVVLVTVTLCRIALLESLISIEVSVVLGLQSLHTTTYARVLTR